MVAGMEASAGEPPREALLLFLRFPEPGRVKTRLIPRLGAVGAAEVYRRLVEDAAGKARALARPGLLCAAFAEPPERLEEVRRWLGPLFLTVAQAEGDLGRRLEEAFTWAFKRGARRAVAIGTDCPGLTVSLLLEAFQNLALNDAVLGPALDGGYYLIGLSRSIPEAFETIPWSTSSVLEATLGRLAAQGASFRLLEALRDLDTPEDYEALYPLWRPLLEVNQPGN